MTLHRKGKSDMGADVSRRSVLLAGSPVAAAMLEPLIANGQTAAATTGKKYQAKAPKTQPFGADAFKASQDTMIRWLGAAGFFINSRGTTVMIDPLLEEFDMPIMIDMPIMPKNVVRLDAVLITHSDTDHYSVATDRDLKRVCKAFHSTKYVATVMQKDGLQAFGHAIGKSFNVGPLQVRLTPVDHDWQNAFPKPGQRHFAKEDCCAFWIETPDGAIWATGDSRIGRACFSPPDSRATANAADGCDPAQLLRRRSVSPRTRQHGEVVEHVPEDACAAGPLGHSGRAGLQSVQWRPTTSGCPRGGIRSESKSLRRVNRFG